MLYFSDTGNHKIKVFVQSSALEKKPRDPELFKVIEGYIVTYYAWVLGNTIINTNVLYI